MKKKSLFRIRSTWQAITAGVLSGIFTVAAVICLLALLLVKIDIPADYVRYLLIAPAIFGGIVSGGVTGKYVRAKGFLWGSVTAAITGLICFCVLLIVNYLAIEYLTVALVPIFVFSGFAGGIIAANMK